jgi:aryl-alcohol dehydrogenase-like predicted oxidoreductase
MRTIPGTELRVTPFCLGGNVFGWTVDERAAFEILDSYVSAGGNFLDTADFYVSWMDGSTGGESESIIGKWLVRRGCRNEVVIATKVGKTPGTTGLAADTIRRGAEASLQRLGTECIDLYYAHEDDESVPLEETLAAFDELVRAGMVRHVGASNYAAPRLAAALEVSERYRLTRYVALQPHYNLVHREEYEAELEALCGREGVACIPYYSLAEGFLTGKYRSGSNMPVASERATAALAYVNERGDAVLKALDEVAAGHKTSVAAVALAWLGAQPTVVAPVASARTPEQLADLLPALTLELSAAESAHLEQASTATAP